MDSVWVEAANAVGCDRYVQKMQAWHIEDSTLANSFQRALKWVSWFAGELHLAAVRIFVVFCFLDGEFMYLNSQKRICFNQSFKMPSIAEMQGEKNCRLCSHFI